MKIKIKMLEAFNGDSFLISLEDNSIISNIIVDGGISKTYIRDLRSQIQSIISKNENIDLMFITHVDDDHIGGFISFFEDDEIDKSIVKRVIYNSALAISKSLNTKYDSLREIDINKLSDKKVSYKQGKTLENELLKYNLLETKVIKTLNQITLGGAIITILSPREIEIKKLNKKWERETSDKRQASSSDNEYKKSIKELLENDKHVKDRSIINSSSISFLLEYGPFKILMLGDSRSDIITKSLNRLSYNQDNKLKVDYVKLPHHGSKKNLYYDLLNIIDCKKYIISTDGSIFNHPDKTTLARILNTFSDAEFYFNSTVYEEIFLEEDKKEYQFACIRKDIMELNDERNI
ncbi:ComEC/Rec2 family competence protein [Clostridium estertheticum]|uniref:ComEC/Rec2 family competence protein n=1 Tax=Clostridium estertheticum TaxID=238834 RepID=UPI001CF3162F|nr:MBL fold metallo-hydrolase [Clostridium estertheticum]MCB2353925.1 MBL fold metallo-hydrolase [Clostridium estertheticum]WAG43066.1 MBL fold metallo-hydrolase [Clostridium estertheticum]